MIAHYLELSEFSDGKAITELKEELSKLREVHSEEIRSLETKLKKVEDKCSAKEKENGEKENSFQDKVIFYKRRPRSSRIPMLLSWPSLKRHSSLRRKRPSSLKQGGQAKYKGV